MTYVKQHKEYTDDIEEFNTFAELVEGAYRQGVSDGDYAFCDFDNYSYRKYSDLTLKQLEELKDTYTKAHIQAHQEVKNIKEKKKKTLASLFNNNQELLKSLVDLNIIEKRMFLEMETAACSQH